jgi:hypothetical protein
VAEVDLIAVGIFTAISTHHTDSLFVLRNRVITVKDFPMRSITLVKGDLKLVRTCHNNEAKGRLLGRLSQGYIFGAPPGIVHLELEVRLCVFLLGGVTEQVLERDREEG